MPAYPVKLTELEKIFLSIISMMEIVYDDAVWVLDIDFETGHVMLAGHPGDVAKFRKELGRIMTSAIGSYANKAEWSMI